MVAVAVKVVLPHPLSVGLVSNAPNWNDGRTKLMESVARSGVLSANLYEIADVASVTGLWRTRLCKAICGDTTADDDITLVEEMSLMPVKVTAAVRVFKFTCCVLLLVVTPVAIDTVHCASVLSVAVLAVKVRVAVAVPDKLDTAVNVVEPHPEVLGVDGVSSVKSGRTTATASSTMRGMLRENVKSNGVGASVTGLVKPITDWRSFGVGAVTTVEVVIAVVAMSVAAARVIAIVLVLRLAT